jgi:hypothetical protein
MRKSTKILTSLSVLAVAAVGTFICIRFYEYVFAKTISGEIVKVERVSQPEALIASGKTIPPEQLFSFAVAIRDPQGEIHTASSEDRQWSVAQPGQCAEARFFPYPPWDLEKARTYHGARLLRLFDCPQKADPKAEKKP